MNGFVIPFRVTHWFVHKENDVKPFVLHGILKK